MPSNIFSLSRSLSKACFLAAVLILVLQSVTLHKISLTERTVPVPELRDLPSVVGAWKQYDEQSLEPDVLDFLRPDSYVLRDYTSESRSSINLFVAYFNSLQNGGGPHSPKNCLPGAGWDIVGMKVRSLVVPGRPEGIPVNQYLLEKAGSRILVFYWYQSDRSVWAEEFQGKLRLVPDLIRYRRSDASLVRLVTELHGSTPGQELGDSEEFARLIFPSLVDKFRAGD